MLENERPAHHSHLVEFETWNLDMIPDILLNVVLCYKTQIFQRLPKNLHSFAVLFFFFALFLIWPRIVKVFFSYLVNTNGYIV